MTLSVAVSNAIMECRIFIGMLSVVMLNVVMLNAVMLKVVILSDVAPIN